VRKRFKCGDDFFYAHRLHVLSEIFPLDSVTVPLQIPRLGPVRKRLDNRLRRPQRCHAHPAAAHPASGAGSAWPGLT
jgi:hypothetical protein